MPARDYIAKVREALDKIEATQMEAMEQASEILASAVRDGRRLFIFGCSHSNILAEEIFYRAGSLALYNPIMAPGLVLDTRPVTRTSKLEQLEGYARIILDSAPVQSGDVMIIASTSGRNAVPVEMALEARERGAYVIALTSMDYSTRVSSRHGSGSKLYELADLVLDNCAEMGDAAVRVEGLPQRVGPLSNITGSVILHSLTVMVAEKLVVMGIEPPVFASGNLDEGPAINERLLRDHAQRIFYM